MKSLTNLFRNRRVTGYLIGTLCLCTLIWLIIVPLIMTGIRSFQTEDGLITGENWGAIGQKENLVAIGNSLLLGISVTGLSILLALPTAWILAKTPLRKAWWIDLILMLVFMAPPYINSTGWLYFMGDSGLLAQWIPSMKDFAASYYSFGGLVFTMSFHSYPFLLTIMKNAILSVPKEIDDSLSIYTRSRLKGIFRVYIPVLLPNFFIGCFLVFVKVLAEYGSPEMFMQYIQFPVFTTILTDYMNVYPVNLGVASSMAYILIFICMFMWMLQSFAISKRTYSLKQDKASKTVGGIPTIAISVVFLFLLFFISTILPLGTIVLYSFVRNLTRPIGWDNFTGRNYVRAFTSDSGFGTGLQAFENSLYISICASLISTVLGLIFSIYSYRHTKHLKEMGKSVETIALIPEMLPNIVMAIGFIMLYNTIRSPIYRQPFMLILAYSIIFLPNTVSYAKSSLLSISSSLTDAGDIYSKNRLKVDTRILVPLTLKNVFYGFSMTFIVAMRELVVAKLLQPPSYYVMSTYIDFQFNQGKTLVGMAMSVIALAMTFLILLPLQGYFMHQKKPKQLSKEEQ